MNTHFEKKMKRKEKNVCFWSGPLGAQFLSRVQLFMTLWTIAHQAPLCMGFFRQEYWSGLPFPTPGDHPDPGIEPVSQVSPELAGQLSLRHLQSPPGLLSSTLIKSRF